VVEDLGEVAPEHGLAPGELPFLAAERAGLVDDAADLVEGEFGGGGGGGGRQRDPAVAAGVVATVREVERALERKAGKRLGDPSQTSFPSHAQCRSTSGIRAYELLGSPQLDIQLKFQSQAELIPVLPQFRAPTCLQTDSTASSGRLRTSTMSSGLAHFFFSP
jgi:hypothetical protein